MPLFIYFKMLPFLYFKSLLNFFTLLFLFYVWLSGQEACGILALRSGIKPIPPTLDCEVSTVGPPGTSLLMGLKCLKENRILANVSVLKCSLWMVRCFEILLLFPPDYIHTVSVLSPGKWRETAWWVAPGPGKVRGGTKWRITVFTMVQTTSTW